MFIPNINHSVKTVLVVKTIKKSTFELKRHGQKNVNCLL